MKYTFDQALDLYNRKQFAESKEILEDLYNSGSQSADVVYLLAIIDFKMGNIPEALKFFELCSKKMPLHAESHYNLGICYSRIDKTDISIEHYKKAIELKPTHSNSLNNLGAIYFDQKKLDEAEQLYSSALKCNPNNNNAISNLGNIKLARNLPGEAIEYYTKALNTIPGEDVEFNFASAYNNIGFVKIEYGLLQEAFFYFDKAIEVDPGYVEAHFNKARAYLLLGNFEKGWEFYEWRTKRKDFGIRQFAKPRLMEQDARGKTVLVYSEQGLGDTLQFIRYLPILKKTGCRVIFECNKVLIPLLSGLGWFDKIIPLETDAEPKIEYDFQIPLLSLPYYFKTYLSSIPVKTPYIFPKKELVEHWSKIISPDKNFKVGIVWAGNPGHIRDKDRSCKITDFLPLFNMEGVTVYVIQKGAAQNQIKDIVYPYVNLNNFSFDEKEPFFDTAAVIENLDLVVCVDTSIAHLAGAMQKPVWTALSFIPDWRWMLNRADTPWYPSMRLFRQPKAGDWASVFTNIKEEIKNILNKPAIGTLINPANNYNSLPYVSGKDEKTIYLGLTSGENFGWGVCSKYLKKELAEKVTVINFDERKDIIANGSVPGSVFHALTDLNFESLFKVRGSRNYGYTFFENELNNSSVENAKKYNKVFAGSTWCKERMEEKNILNGDVLIQGVDPELFYPIEDEASGSLFRIFSGGKFELRKGQDLVLRAVKILQEKYKDVILINSWYNIWPATMEPMALSKHICFELSGSNWLDQMRHICKINNIDGDRIFTLPLTPNTKMRELYSKTDIGLFPNRCEGGTNLVLMEYMACAKPVIASFNSGHKDILTDENSYPLYNMTDYKIRDAGNNLICSWADPDLDEIVARLEYAYNNRQAIKQKGIKAGEELKKLTWKTSAETLLSKIQL